MSSDRDNGSTGPVTPWRRIAQHLGLAYAPGGQPRRRGPSRYWAGATVSRRLDEDLDELRRRIEDLERRRES